MIRQECKREHQRIRVDVPAVLVSEIDAEESDSLLSNLSLGGCFIRSSRPSAAATRLRLTFRLPGTAHDIAALGEVRWVQRSGAPENRGLGVQFVEIAPEDLLVLKRYVEDRLEESLLW